MNLPNVKASQLNEILLNYFTLFPSNIFIISITMKLRKIVLICISYSFRTYWVLNINHGSQEASQTVKPKRYKKMIQFPFVGRGL